MANVAKIVYYGPWQIPVRVEHCLCPDGKRRNVKITGEADTYWTLPAKVSYKGTSVTGFVCANSDDYGCTIEGDYKLCAYGKNAQLFDGSK